MTVNRLVWVYAKLEGEKLMKTRPVLLIIALFTTSVGWAGFFTDADPGIKQAKEREGLALLSLLHRFLNPLLLI
ncbi:MAG: hypothetical protein CL388_03605 [Acidiferrobacteraceae bacterium]|nr:hypothetical protein [Acidiferrobacteraceae bacterium]MAG00284.1 hypothetical protein [Acidiferrobacteraceae bacterium]